MVAVAPEYMKSSDTWGREAEGEIVFECRFSSRPWNLSRGDWEFRTGFRDVYRACI